MPARAPSPFRVAAWFRLAACAASLLGTVCLIGPARAQTVTWTHRQISTVNGAMPSIEVDRLGYVHVGWTLGLGGSSYYAYHATNTSGDYATTLVDSKTTGGPTPYFPYLTTDSLGFFHMVWRDLGLTGSKPILYRTNNPETRSLVKMSFSSSGHTHDPLVEVTPDDIAHVVTEADSCTGCPSGSNLYDESFTTTTAFAGRVMSLVQDANDATGVQQFSSTTTMDGTRHMVFSMRLAPPADNQRLIYYTSRAPGSLTWSVPVSITGHQDTYQGWPGIVADPSGTLHVVYSCEDYGIYYVRRTNGGPWSTPLRINDQNSVPDAIPSVTVDPNGRLHVVFQRYSGGNVSLYYTTNAYDANDWLDPASLVLSNVGTFTLTHQNRKVAVNWVDNQVLVPYLSGNAIWLASSSDPPVTPLGPNGTSTLTADPTFTPPTTLSRASSNTAGTAATVMKFSITDGGGDVAPTRIRALHFHAGGAQSFTPVSGKDEVLSYLLAGAQVVTDQGQVLPALISDTKLVVRDVNQALLVPSGATRSFALQVWVKNVTQVTGKRVDLRLKPDQDVVVDPAASTVAVDQPIVETEGMLIVDTPNPGTGGATGTGGSGLGGMSGSGGAPASGGASGTGGTSGGTGGAATGGAATGGAATGGAATGGAATGGAATGGMMMSSTGGAATGGMTMASGGASGTGGAASGGMMMSSTGGTSTGGAATGGMVTSGSSGGGGTSAPDGGVAGASAGGAVASTGGSPAGSGGNGSGGAPAGADAATSDGAGKPSTGSGGCGCAVAVDPSGGTAGVAVAMALVASALSRRRRR